MKVVFYIPPLWIEEIIEKIKRWFTHYFICLLINHDFDIEEDKENRSASTLVKDGTVVGYNFLFILS